MKHFPLKFLALCFIAFTLQSCSTKNNATSSPSSTAPSSNPTLLPVFDVTITVRPPEGTQENADLALLLLDEVTDWTHNATIHPMTRMGDGRWQVSFNPPAGSLIRYRYIRQSPSVISEADTDGRLIQNRILYISGSTHVEDIIATWDGVPYIGETGRVIGRLVNAQNGEPLTEMITNIAGKTVFTDVAGNYRIDGLVPGLNTITAFSPDGSYSPAQQGAVIEAHSTTPAQMGMFPAKLVQVTFEVTVPEDTLEGTQLRVAGNLKQFGHLFTELPGGISNAIELMPTLSEVDPTHYTLVANLYAGTHLRYKYTLGDGLVNAERDEDGALLTRELLVPDNDTTTKDTIARWQGKGQGSVLFWLEVPSVTPSSDIVSLQLNPSTPASPIPMWKIGDHQWFYSLYNYPMVEGAVEYRYCRNQQCGIADDMQTSGSDPQWRTFSPSTSKVDIRDAVDQWNWLNDEETTSFIPPVVVERREGFNVGVELLAHYTPSWESHLDIGIRRISELGSNSIILTPSWVVRNNNLQPDMEFDPAFSPYLDNLKLHIEKAQSLGLQVELHPYLIFESQNPTEWWEGASQDYEWWSVWFERYRDFIITYAQIASETQVSKIILGSPEIAPSLPPDEQSDSASSAVIPEADAKWRELISEVRSIFNGQIAFELDLGTSLQNPPSFIDTIDEIYLYWHTPLASTTSANLEDFETAARSIITNDIFENEAISGKAVYLNVEYASVDGSTLGCQDAVDLNCLPAETFDLGSVGSAFLPVDLQEQAEAIYAVIAEAYVQPGIQGVFIRRYNPIVQLKDKSASVYGKPAQAVLELWYPQISGQ